MKSHLFSKGIFAFLAISLSMNVIAQKPSVNKYEGFYKNVPIYNLDISGYEYYSSTSNNVKNILDKENLSLKLNGFNEGTGILIVFSCSDPIVSSSIEVEEKMVNNVPQKSYYGKITANTDSRVMFLDENKNPLFMITAEPNKRSFEKETFKKSSKSEAQGELKKSLEFNTPHVKKNYIKALMEAYQNKLDAYFGDFNKGLNLRVFTLESKKFDYSEFNKATEDFIKATSSSEIDSPENQTLINNTMEVWLKNYNDYSDDKKARISKKNIDEIQFNLTMGYLVLGNGEKYSEFWQKCLDTKGVNNGEAKARFFMPEIVDNYKTKIAKNGVLPTMDDCLSENKKLNNMIARAFTNAYISGIYGNLYYIEDYFPANNTFVSSASSTLSDNEGITQELSYSYSLPGCLSAINYKTTGHPKGDKKIKMRFNYDEKTGNIDEVFANNRSIFKFIYSESDKNKIEEITHEKVGGETFLFRLAYTEENKIEIKLFKDNGSDEPKLLSSSNRIEYAEGFFITDLYINSNGMSKVKRDDDGSIVEFSCTDPADNRITIPLEISKDAKGNAIKSASRMSKTESSIVYMY